MKARALSLSTIVTVALTTPGNAPPVRLVSASVKISLPSINVSSRMDTVMIFSISPLAKVRVLVTPV